MLTLHRDGWQDGSRIGFEAGRAAEGFERDLAWQEMARSVARNGEVMARRWMLRGQPRTRGTFGQPHPADYPGRVAS